MQTLPQTVAKMFGTPDGKIVDVLYSTSDSQVHFNRETAVSIASSLPNKVVTTYYRNAVAREIASKDPKLQSLLFLSDYLQACKLNKIDPSYGAYKRYCADNLAGPRPENIYDFVRKKVMWPEHLAFVGKTSEICTLNSEIVKGQFLRSDDTVKIWQVASELVVTTPVHIELVRASYSTIFAPLVNMK